MRKVLICLLAMILTACGAAATEGLPASPRTPVSIEVPSASPDEAVATDVPTAGPADVLAVWSRSGGFAGRDDKMTIYTDGRLQIEQDGASSTVQGDMTAVEALRQLVTGSEWQNLEKSYGKQVPDAFAYRVEAGGKTVQTYDGAEMPAALTEVLEQINSLYAAASQASTPEVR